MKKFLTVLLALSVVFTYSFSAVGSAFAATEYTLDDYSKALASEKAAQLTYLDKAKDQAIGLYKFDEDGFANNFMKAAYEAAAQKVIDKATTAMDAKINDVLNGTFPTTAAPDKTVVAEAAKVGPVGNEDVTIANNMKAAIKAETDTLNKVQAPLTKAFVEGKLNVDLSKYNSVDKDYDATGTAVATGGVLTAVQAMQKAIDEAKAAIKAADKETDDANKITGYMNAKDAFETAFGKIKTLEDEAYEDGINDGTVEGAVNAFAKVMLEDIMSTKLSISPNMAADATRDWTVAVADKTAVGAFWEADKTATKGKIFGVAIANIGKVTRTEVAAVNVAIKATVASTKDPIVAYANGKVNAVPTAVDYKLFINATKAADVYADVVALGQKMKSEYMYGVKVYDDAKVDAAVKAAEKLVYADLATSFKDAKIYIENAAKGDLAADNYEIVKFEKAIEDAAKKMFSTGTDAAYTPAVKVLYGDNKTPEADFVYLKEIYATTEASAWEKIAKDAVADLKDAQSYEEINAIMAQAAADFGKLLKADDEIAVTTARTSYETALGNYAKLKNDLADKTKYTAGDSSTNNLLKEFFAALEQGKDLIAKANTVKDVEAAYAEGQKIIDSVKTADELKAAKEAVEKQISELPYTAKLTVADKAAVVAAYKAYDAYMNMPGAVEVANKKLLQDKYDKVNELAAKDIDAAAKAINDKIAALHLDANPANWSDADVAAMAALKAEADAVKADAKALKAEITAVNEDNNTFLNDVTFTEVDKLSTHNFAAAKAGEVERMLVKASNDGATVEEMKAALAAYEQLTDRQKYELDSTVLQYVKVINEKLIKEVKSFKIKVTTKRYTGSKMRINWTATGDESAIDGYRVYYSTKKTNSGYKYLAKTTKKYINHTSIKKNVKKGTRVYYRVRAYVEIDGQRYFSDYSTVGNRIWK
ncbi:fibronectin type III domain-containing protein [Anaerovoracaceae bacterium 42-11]